jgi:hypothetical protein
VRRVLEYVFACSGVLLSLVDQAAVDLVEQLQRFLDFVMRRGASRCGRSDLGRARSLVGLARLERHALSFSELVEAEPASDLAAVKEVLVPVFAADEAKAAIRCQSLDGSVHGCHAFKSFVT